MFYVTNGSGAFGRARDHSGPTRLQHFSYPIHVPSCMPSGWSENKFKDELEFGASPIMM